MNIILGAGISGISAGYHLNQKGQKATIYEKNNSWGGVCGNFEINGFRFDHAIHLSFTKIDHVKKLFDKSTEKIVHEPLPYNYYKGIWLKHPAQNNLFPLSPEEKTKAIEDFISVQQNPPPNIENYADWLRAQYGPYFSENFPLRYTKKYWTLPAEELSVNWVGERMYLPKISEVLEGAFSDKTPNTYYAKKMYYPTKGGYSAFLKHMAKQCNIETNSTVSSIDIERKKISFKCGKTINYSRLISSLPLPEYAHLLKNIPEEIKQLCADLKYTSVGLVSIGLKKPDLAKHLWFYIYDENILASRCYSPSLKSPDNAPSGCSSLQFEIYFSKNRPLTGNGEEVIELAIGQAIEMGLFESADVIVKDFRSLKYANVIFDHGMEVRRDKIRTFLLESGVETIGRYGKWDYLWSDQSLMTGAEV